MTGLSSSNAMWWKCDKPRVGHAIPVDEAVPMGILVVRGVITGKHEVRRGVQITITTPPQRDLCAVQAPEMCTRMLSMREFATVEHGLPAPYPHERSSSCRPQVCNQAPRLDVFDGSLHSALRPQQGPSSIGENGFRVFRSWFLGGEKTEGEKPECTLLPVVKT